MDITLDQIRSLEAITAEGSFSAAARALNKARTAVSYDIHKLETALGILLFDRSGHRAVLTSEGRGILEEGRLLLARANGLETLAARYREGWEPRMQVVIDGILPMDPIMKVLKALADEGVPTQITTRIEFLAGVQTRFEREGAEIMLVKDFHKSSGLSAVPLKRQESLLLAAPGHPLIRDAGSKRWSKADLREHIQLTVQDSSNRTDSLDAYLFGGNRVYYLSDFFTKRKALIMELGFGWMPYHMVKDELNAGELCEVPYSGESRYNFTPFLVYPTDRPPGRTGNRFQELLKECFPEGVVPPGL